MNAALQITTLVATLLLSLLLGAIFESGYFQAAVIAEEKRGDQPSPAISLLLSQNHRALFYGMLIPWLGFVGAPAFRRGRSYFEATDFLIRLAAFASVQALFTVFLLLFLVLPFVPYYLLMDAGPNTGIESTVMVGFWILVAAVMLSVAARVVRFVRNGGTRRAESVKPE